MNRQLILFFIFVFAAGSFEVVNAQLRKDVSSYRDYSGPIVRTQERDNNGPLSGLLKNMVMSHSYSMNFSSFAGQTQNINAYTNTMQFFFNEKLTGRMDVSFLHSPFGGSSFANNGNGGFGGRVLVQNAELNYKVNDKTFIHLSFSQNPYGFGGNPYLNRGAFGRGFQRSPDFWY